MAGMMQNLMLFDTEQHEPIASIFGQDNRFQQRDVAIDAKIAKEFNSWSPFHRTLSPTRDHTQSPAALK